MHVLGVVKSFKTINNIELFFSVLQEQQNVRKCIVPMWTLKVLTRRPFQSAVEVTQLLFTVTQCSSMAAILI